MPAPPKKKPSSFRTFIFISLLCLSSALILSIAAALLKEPQEKARALDKIKQLLIASKLLNYDDVFLLLEKNKFIPAKYDAEKGILIPGSIHDKASEQDIFNVYKKRVEAGLINDQGKFFTFAEAQIEESTYIEENKLSGYASLPYKLIYLIKPNEMNTSQETLPFAYVIPIKGFGLWAAIYGYLALEANADTILGTTWYDQKETAGLGAVIAEANWQKQFFHKQIFQESSSGKTDVKTAPLGITVVKGSVQDVFGSTPKAKSAVDGIPGATLTGNGVTNAYFDTLKQYRPFLMKAHDRYISNKGAQS